MLTVIIGDQHALEGIHHHLSDGGVVVDVQAVIVIKRNIHRVLKNPGLYTLPAQFCTYNIMPVFGVLFAL